MSTANATLLPPPCSSTIAERGSVRHLEEVGIETVLGAMIEQKRRGSQPSYPAVSEADLAAARGAQGDDAAPSRRPPTRSEVFLKAR